MLEALAFEVIMLMEAVMLSEVLDHFPHIGVVGDSGPELVPDVGETENLMGVLHCSCLNILLLTENFEDLVHRQVLSAVNREVS